MSNSREEDRCTEVLSLPEPLDREGYHAVDGTRQHGRLVVVTLGHPGHVDHREVRGDRTDGCGSRPLELITLMVLTGYLGRK